MRRRSLLRMVADGFDVVPLGIDDERPVVVGMIVGADSRRPVVLAASLQRGVIKRAHLGSRVAAECHVHARRGARAAADPEIRFAADTESGPAFHFHDELVAEGSSAVR